MRHIPTAKYLGIKVANELPFEDVEQKRGQMTNEKYRGNVFLNVDEMTLTL
jgi:hypothetical protein